MRGFILLALLGLAVAKFPSYPWDEPSGVSQWDDYSTVEKEVYTERDIKEKAFRPGQQYKYFYDGQMMNGFPRSSKQHSGTRIQCVVLLQMESQDTMLMELKHIRIGKLNRKILSPRLLLPFRFYTPVQLDQKFKQKMELPVKFQYVDGLIKNIFFESDDVPEVTNIKRGIMNLMQINLKEHRSIETEEQRLTNIASPQLGRSKFYRVMESTVEGECETQYTVIRKPAGFHRVIYEAESSEDPEISTEPRLNVTKSINFAHCNRRPQVKYNYRNVVPCKSCDSKFVNENKGLKSSSIIRYNLIGNRQTFLIDSAKAESQHTLEYYSEEGSYINVYINQTFRLYKTEPISKPIQQRSPGSEETELLYTQEWDTMNEKVWMESEQPEKQLRNKPINFVDEVAELFKTLARRVAKNPETAVNVHATGEYSLLVTALRKADLTELKKLSDMVYKNPSSLGLNQHEIKFLEDIVEPAIALTGTRAAIKHLSHVIKHKEVSKTIAVTAVRQLSNARVVSMTIVNQMKTLCQETNVRNYPPLKRVCYLSLGSLMYAACSNHFDQLAVDAKTPKTRCTSTQKKEIVELLINKMKEHEHWEDKVLYLKALANAGVDISILELEKVIRNTEQYYPEYVRYEAIVATHRILHIMPHRVQKTLMAIYMNPREPVALRTVSVHLLLTSQPDRSVLDTIAQQVNVEPYRQVATYTYQLMYQLANVTDECERRLAEDITLALRFVRKVEPSLYDSKSFYQSFYNLVRKTGYGMFLFELLSNNTFIPKAVGGYINSNTFGYKTPAVFYWNLMMDGVETLIPKLWQTDGTLKFSLSDLLTRQQRDLNGRQLLRDIFDKLKIKKRTLRRDLMTYAEYGLLGHIHGYYPLDQEWTEYFTANGIVPKIERALRSGTHRLDWYHATMLQETQLKLPTLLGLPLVIKHKTPLVMKLEGTVKPTLTGMWDKLDIVAHLRPSFAVKNEHTVEMWSPVAASGARVREGLKVHLPIYIDAKIDIQNKQLEFGVKQPIISKELFRLETMPVTFTRRPMEQQKLVKEAQEKIVQGEEINRVTWVDQYYKYLGFEFHLKNRYTPVVDGSLHTTWFPFSPISGPIKISLRAMKPRDNTKEVDFKINLKGSYRKTEELRPTLLKTALSESETESLSSEELETTQFKTEQHRFGAVVMEIKTKGGAEPKQYFVTLKTMGSLKGRFTKYIAKISRVSPEPYEVCMDSEVFYPPQPHNRKSIQGKKIKLETKFRWGQDCNSNKHIQISTVGERTRQQQKWEVKHLENYHECNANEDVSPLQCYDYLRHAGFLSKYSFNIKYNNVPVEIKNYTSLVFRALKTYYYWNSDVAQFEVHNPSNQIKAVLRIDPNDRRRINATIRIPQENVTFTDVIAPIRIPRFNIKRTFIRNMLDEVAIDNSYKTFLYVPLCNVHSNHADSIQTFDGHKYLAPLTTCWSVLAKDCSEEQRYAVLMKKVSKTSERKVVKIVSPDTIIEMQKSGAEYIVKINNEKVAIGDETSDEMYTEEHRTKKCFNADSYIMCRIPEADVRVYYDGFSAHIKVSNFYVGKQCGLCGHMNYEPTDDFQTPEFHSTYDLREFQRRWVYKDEECQGNSLPEVKDICPNRECTYEPEYEKLTSAETSDESPFQYHNKHKKHPEPRKLNLVLHRMGRTCFSKEAVNVCPEYAQTKEARQMEVEFGCLDEDDVRAYELAHAAQISPITEARELPTEFTETEIIPTSCKRYRTEYEI